MLNVSPFMCAAAAVCDSQQGFFVCDFNCKTTILITHRFAKV